MTINYIDKGPSLFDAIRAAGHTLICESGVWVASDNAAVQAIIDNHDPLPAMRADLLAQVAAKRIAVQQTGLSYAFPDGQTGAIQTRNEQDTGIINGLVTAALVLQAQGVTEPALSFRDEQNTTHAMTPAQMIAMGMAASQFVSATYAAKWAHDTALAQWDGSAPYDITTGWPG